MKFTEDQKQLIETAYEEFGDVGIRHLELIEGSGVPYLEPKLAAKFKKFIETRKEIWATMEHMKKGYTFGDLMEEIEIDRKYGPELKQLEEDLRKEDVKEDL